MAFCGREGKIIYIVQFTFFRTQYNERRKIPLTCGMSLRNAKIIIYHRKSEFSKTHLYVGNMWHYAFVFPKIDRRRAIRFMVTILFASVSRNNQTFNKYIHFFTMVSWFTVNDLILTLRIISVQINSVCIFTPRWNDCGNQFYEYEFWNEFKWIAPSIKVIYHQKLFQVIVLVINETIISLQNKQWTSNLFNRFNIKSLRNNNISTLKLISKSIMFW